MTDLGASDLPVMDAAFLSNPYPHYAKLREAGAVHRMRGSNGLRMWVVSRYAEAREALAHPALSKDISRSHELGYLQRELGDSSFGHRLTTWPLSHHMLNLDPPEHTRLRKLASSTFTAGRVQRLRPRIEQISLRLLDEIERTTPPGEPADMISAYAEPLPVIVIGELLGLPDEDLPQLREWTAVLMSNVDPSFRKVTKRIARYFNDVIDAKRERPGTDLISGLLAVDDDGGLTQVELVSMAFMVLVAGHETTLSLICNGLRALLNHPHQGAALRADPAGIPRAVEEFLRFEAPLSRSTLRYVAAEVTIGGVTMSEGDYVVVLIGSANRDEGAFDRAEELDLKRRPSGHLAFGHGIHYCLGAPLARLEGEIAFGHLLSRYPDLRPAVPDADLVWRDSTLVHSFEHLPVILR
ncbi:cytochrome P450 family protein [Micromonospora sp. DT53]|uniref:cytochrome P450 family protein n=1 Tax=Micromonospora sp. DT53 TaxID=3393444 RepID=UPI003CEB8E99